ncbi:MAG: hypothetical protein F6K48_22720 [Okeania sp. SIO3H1]|uniref:hypothetical protein n=1 Tax=Okeania sp. SIO1I7 TaxID=2607772 RepID=UPI0013CD7D14|nr:hypothetical protein [Okeania sp. SIO1I7]NEN91563.1 hypothetical protein [Okeania sp. SIO3H1]NET30337.1 hypothetical protein [Okeania sp. SIO1I7]
MSTEHDYQQLYEQNKKAIAIQEAILYSLYQTRIKIKSQLLEQILNQGENQPHQETI